MGVSKKNGTPKSSILIGLPTINHPFWGVNTPIFGNMHIYIYTHDVVAVDSVKPTFWHQMGTFKKPQLDNVEAENCKAIRRVMKDLILTYLANG